MLARQIVQRPSRQLTSLVRSSRAPLRAESTTAKATEAVKNVTSKAGEGLSKVSSSASETASNAGSKVAETAKSSGGRIGGMVSSVQGTLCRALDAEMRKIEVRCADEAVAMIPVVTHQARVALEVGKIVAKGQGMGIP